MKSIELKDNPASFNLNENLDTVRFSYFKSVYVKSIKTITLYATNGEIRVE